MLKTTKAARYLSAIVLVTVGANIFTLPTNAQSRTADSFNFDEITAGGKGSWDFSNIDETTSIRNNLNQLGEYDVDEINTYDIRLIHQNNRKLGTKRWGNRGDRSYDVVDDNFYPYFYDRRFYDYHNYY